MRIYDLPIQKKLTRSRREKPKKKMRETEFREEYILNLENKKSKCSYTFHIILLFE